MEWCADTDRCCKSDLICLYCGDISTSLLDSEGEEDEVVLEEEEAVCWRIHCSISCSCWSAFTKAAFRRFVCSAFRAFFWLDDMHWSQRMVPAFSFLQREVKSVLHWAQVYGSLELELAMEAAGPRLPRYGIILRQYWLFNIFTICCCHRNHRDNYPPRPCISSSFWTTSSNPNK